MKPKFVIIEGPDRCGKSTLTANLAHELGPYVFCNHSSSPPKCDDPLAWEISHYGAIVTAYTTLAHEDAAFNFISDRFHIGVPVYGQRYRNYSNTVTSASIEEKIFSGYNKDIFRLADVYLILVTDSVESIMARDDGMSLETDPKQMTETLENFTKQFDLSTIEKKAKYNVSQIGFANLLPQVKGFIGL